jgi:putative ABC transport system permease protein
MVKIHRKMQLKLLRDLKAAKFQFGAVVIVILLGIAMYIGSYGAYLNLYKSYEYSFDLLHMGDYWISLDYVSDRAVTELEKMPGVTAEGRIIGKVQIDIKSEGGERIEGKVISLPPYNHPSVNQIIVDSGTYFTDTCSREVLVEKHFADYHQLKPGDELVIESNNVKATYYVAGIITSPEYIYVTKSEQDIMPQPRTFGVLFVSYPTAEKLFGMTGMVNEISLTVADDVDRVQVRKQIEDTLLRFDIKRVTFKDDPVSLAARRIDVVRGVRSAYVIERADQVVNKLLKQDLDSFQQIAFLFPLLFITIACFTIYILLNRLIESQRVQIGLMRGLGYSRLSVLLHYSSFALVVGVMGAILGALLGNWISSWMTRFYVSQLNLPYTIIEISWETTITGIIIGILIPVISGLIPAISAMRLRPAVAMRPPSPAVGNKLLIETIFPFFTRMPYLIKMTLRNIFRKFRQSIFMALGVAFAVMLVLLSLSFVDTFNNAIRVQFDVIQKYDAIVYFQGTGQDSLANYVQHLGGIKKAEPMFQAPYRIRFGNEVVDTSITGLPPDSQMFTLKTPGGQIMHITEDGILLPAALSNKLGAKVGDTLILEPLTGTVGNTEKVLAGYVDFFMGGRAFMPIREVQKMTDNAGLATGIILTFDGKPSAELLQRLYDLPNAVTIEFTEDARQFMDEQMAFMWAFIIFMLIMGVSLGGAIIFNSVTVNVLQRTRELAMMKVIGRGNAFITSMITMENLLVGLVGAGVGIPLGLYVAQIFMDTVNASAEEAMSLNIVVAPESYVFAIAVALVMLLVSQIPALRQVRRMSLTTALKDWYE